MNNFRELWGIGAVSSCLVSNSGDEGRDSGPEWDSLIKEEVGAFGL